jgi:hypothetical protein
VDAQIQPALELSTDGITRYVWKMQYGQILIEVFADGSIAVNGKVLDTDKKADFD